MKEAREATACAQGIEDAVYDLKAVNPNKQNTRTTTELLDLIEAKGREVSEALAALRALGA